MQTIDWICLAATFGAGAGIFLGGMDKEDKKLAHPFAYYAMSAIAGAAIAPITILIVLICCIGAFCDWASEKVEA
jgi:hypothetical protein